MQTLLVVALIVLWVVLVALSALHLMRRDRNYIGLTVAYLAILTLSHLPAPFVQILPWYTPTRNPQFTQQGYVISVVALISFLIGVMVVQPTLHLSAQRNWSNTPPVKQPPPAPTARSLPLAYFGIGLLSYFILTPLFGTIPTLSSVLSNAGKLLFIGAILVLYQVKTGDRPRYYGLVLIPVLAWPLVTVTNEGFLGFGIVSAGITLIFLLKSFQVRLSVRNVLVVVVVSYFSLSLISTYLATRETIRGSVWNGDTLRDRTEVVYQNLVSNFIFFNIFDQKQLSIGEERLDLDYQTGLAMERINAGIVDYENGSTIISAGLMLIPRFIWLDKPIILGGNVLVSQFTGMQFPVTTTVSLGHVMEFYINFGLLGVIIGFIILGVLISAFDKAAAVALLENRFYAVAFYLTPAFGFLLVGDDLIALTGTVGSALVTVAMMNLVIRTFYTKPQNFMATNARSIQAATKTALDAKQKL